METVTETQSLVEDLLKRMRAGKPPPLPRTKRPRRSDSYPSHAV